MMSYPSKTGQSVGLHPGEHGGMSYLTMDPRKGPGPGRFPNLDPRSFEAHEFRGLETGKGGEGEE